MQSGAPVQAVRPSSARSAATCCCTPASCCASTSAARSGRSARHERDRRVVRKAADVRVRVVRVHDARHFEVAALAPAHAPGVLHHPVRAPGRRPVREAAEAALRALVRPGSLRAVPDDDDRMVEVFGGVAALHAGPVNAADREPGAVGAVVDERATAKCAAIWRVSSVQAGRTQRRTRRGRRATHFPV